MPNIDLDDEFLNLFFSITNKSVPGTLNLHNMKQQLIDVVDVIKSLNENSKKQIKSNALGNNEEEESGEDSSAAILVIDDLGVITYQLKVLLSRFEMDVDCSQEIYDAVNCVAHNYASKEERQIAEEFFSQYDKVILCEDGDFKVLK